MENVFVVVASTYLNVLYNQQHPLTTREAISNFKSVLVLIEQERFRRTNPYRHPHLESLYKKSKIASFKKGIFFNCSLTRQVNALVNANLVKF